MMPILASTCPHNELPDPARTVNYTMWETSHISALAVDRCNALRAVAVPCAAVADWFLASGVTAPIRIVPLAIDVAVFCPAGRFDRPRPPGPARFGCGGRTAHGGVRKGLDDVVAAFLDAFPDPADGAATLDVKCWPDCRVFDPGDARVRILRTPLPEADLAAWYRSLDAFVSASRGEGWGLQPHQAMGTGTPAIAAIWGGHSAYMTPDCCYPLEHDERPAEGPIYGGLGDWCVPRHASLVARLREVAADPAAARAKGEAAARRAAEFPWERAGRAMAAVLDEFRL